MRRSEQPSLDQIPPAAFLSFPSYFLDLHHHVITASALALPALGKSCASNAYWVRIYIIRYSNQHTYYIYIYEFCCSRRMRESDRVEMSAQVDGVPHLVLSLPRGQTRGEGGSHGWS